MNKIWKETALEFLRVIVIAILPVILLGINQENGAININWQLVLATGLIAFIRALDKYIYETGKYFDNASLKKGLVRF